MFNLSSENPAIRIGVALILCSAMWSYVLIAWPLSQRTLTDLYARWYGSRELLLHHRDPYSPEITREIQQWHSGRPARPGEDENRFAYPVYVAFLLAPTVTLRFSPVNDTMFWILLLCCAGTAYLCFRLVGWRPSGPSSVIVVLLSLSSFPVVHGLRLRQLSLLVGLLIAASLTLISRSHFSLAGSFLALATIKPQLTILIVPWLLVWVFSDWRHRRPLFWSFGLTMVILFASSELFVSGWMLQFLHGVFAYVHYTDGRSILQLLFTPIGGSLVSAVVIFALGRVCLESRFAASESKNFVFCSALVLAATVTIIPTMAPHAQVLLFPGLFLIFYQWNAIRDGGRWCRYSALCTSLLFAWPWLAAAGFTCIAVPYGKSTAMRFWLVPASTSPLLPLSVMTTLMIARFQLAEPARVPLDC